MTNGSMCRCQYRPGAVCINTADGPDGLCTPCRIDGGDGHPHKHDRLALPDGCVDGHSPDLVNCALGADWP